jgi:hypothetical protein
LDLLPGDIYSNAFAINRIGSLSESAVEGLNKRLETRYLPVLQEIRRQDVGEMTAMLETLAVTALMAITPEDLEAASARDKVIISAIAIDKSLLLRGEATAIVRHEGVEVSGIRAPVWLVRLVSGLEQRDG